MEAKKNPNKDLNLQRNKFFLIGLSISVSLAITAFEWRTIKEKRVVCNFGSTEIEVLPFIPITPIDLPPAPQPMQKMESKKTVATDITPSNFVTGEPDKNQPQINFEPEPGLAITPVHFKTDSVETVDPVFVFVENQPEPLKSYKFFYEQLGKNTKYPRQAVRNGIEGKVTVEFIVNKNGEPSDLKVIKGIGSGCDEEAMRVLSLMKWKPGEQRGKAVRVRMALPIFFQLSR
jgi:periplasmic protein TonB